MRQFYLGILITAALTGLHGYAGAQGYVGIGTTTPSEKLDVNGAIIVRGDATAATPVAGTIRWNSTDGMHDGRTGAGQWRRLENDISLLSGDYYTIACGAALTTSVGGGASTSVGAFDTPFGSQYPDNRKQFLYFASELTSAGFCAGNITAIGYNVITLGTANINNWTIKMKNTATASFTGTTWEIGMTTVYGAANITLVAGTNTFTLTTPFYWDGTSNIIIETCFDNGAAGGTNSSVNVLNTGVNKNRYYNLTLALSSGCTVGTATASTISRPNVIITGKTTGPTPTTTNYLYSAQPWVVGSPSLPAPYLHHGPGSVTAQACYDDNTLLSDYVFDHYFDGEVLPQDKALHVDYQMASLPEMINFMEENRHLPTIQGRSDWQQNGKFSVGELSTYLWETSETQALYIIEMKKRLDALKASTSALDDNDNK